jgi:hypothetical protein
MAKTLHAAKQAHKDAKGRKRSYRASAKIRAAKKKVGSFSWSSKKDGATKGHVIHHVGATHAKKSVSVLVASYKSDSSESSTQQKKMGEKSSTPTPNRTQRSILQITLLSEKEASHKRFEIVLDLEQSLRGKDASPTTLFEVLKQIVNRIHRHKLHDVGLRLTEKNVSLAQKTISAYREKTQDDTHFSLITKDLGALNYRRAGIKKAAQAEYAEMPPERRARVDQVFSGLRNCAE